MKPHLPNASEEQLKILQLLKTNNVVVDSVAGSGKTTSILHIATNFKINILLLTYNKRLKFETRAKALALKIKNIEVHSYHSFCCKYYGGNCRTDSIIIRILDKNTPPKPALNFDLIILDEAQDITPVYFELVNKVFKDNITSPRLCLFGDRNQCIFRFNNADERYIIYANQLFNVNSFPWIETKLSTTFRLTSQNAEFLNKVVLKSDRLNAMKKGEKVRYIVCDCFAGKLGLVKSKSKGKCQKVDSSTYDEVVDYLSIYQPEDIFVLAPSIKGEKSPVRQLANLLTENNIPIFVPNSDEEAIDDDILRGKIAFCTFHQVKGLERKVVIVFNFDETYYKYYNRNANPNICANELYVALTRSSERLTMFHHYSNDYLPFLNPQLVKKYCIFEEHDKLRLSKNKDDKDNRHKIEVSTTELLKHLPSSVLDNAMKFIQVQNLENNENKSKLINIPLKTQQGDLFENVSEISGTAIPAYYEILANKNCTILNVLKREDANVNSDRTVMPKPDPIPTRSLFKTHKIVKTRYNDTEKNAVKQYDISKIDINDIKIDELLYLANRYCALLTGYNYKINQIINYDWLSSNNLNECMNRLKTIISGNAQFEKKIVIKNKEELMDSRRELIGFIDCVDGDNIYEFKCVSSIEPEHCLQHAIYKYMYETQILEELEIEADNIEQDQIIKAGTEIQYVLDSDVDTVSIYTGIISRIYKNGSIGINKKKIKADNIVANLTNEKQLLELQNRRTSTPRNYYLFNILSGSKYAIHATYDDLCKLIHYLVESKYYNNHTVSDDEFITNMIGRVKKYGLPKPQPKLQPKLQPKPQPKPQPKLQPRLQSKSKQIVKIIRRKQNC